MDTLINEPSGGDDQSPVIFNLRQARIKKNLDALAELLRAQSPDRVEKLLSDLDRDQESPHENDPDGIAEIQEPGDGTSNAGGPTADCDHE